MRTCVCGTAGFTMLACCGLFGQPAFEVASVKPSAPQESVIGLFTYPGGRITATNYTLEMLMEEAYGVQASKASKLTPPYPKWPPNDEQRLMLQSLLAERFHLQLHREMKEGPVYVLTVGNKGVKLQPAKSADDYPWVGRPGGGAISGSGIAGTNATMQLLATRLTGYLRRPVIDQTGLRPAFDFRVDLPLDESQPDVIASIFTSIQGLGLKLDAAKSPVETLVIDHAEKPSEN